MHEPNMPYGVVRQWLNDAKSTWLVFCVAAACLAVLQLSWLLVGVTPVVAQVFGQHHTSQGLHSGKPLLQIPQFPAPHHNLASAPLSTPHDLANSNTSAGVLPHHLLYVLLMGLVASRFGLWLFDLAVTQLQQELVPATELGECWSVRDLCLWKTEQGNVINLLAVALHAADVCVQPSTFPENLKMQTLRGFAFDGQLS